MTATTNSLFTCLLVLICCGSLAAQNVTLTGKITNKETGLPLENALVEVGEVITYSNSEGDFLLRVPHVDADELKVMHMGYDLSIQDITEKPYSIRLEAVNPETSTYQVSTSQLMNQVFAHIHTNYELEDQLIKAYYKETLISYSSIFHFGEGVLEVRVPRSPKKGNVMVRPIRTRVKTLEEFSSYGLYEKSGHATEMIQSGVLAFNTFLSEKNQEDYEFSLVGREVHRNENVFIVDFQPNGRKGTVRGRLWIDERSYAVIRIEYSPVGRTLWDSEKWVEEFQHHNHTYYLMRASFEGHLREGGIPYVFNSLVVNTEIEPNTKRIRAKEFVSGKDFTFLKDTDGTFTEDFWGNYNHILLTENERLQLTSN